MAKTVGFEMSEASLAIIRDGQKALRWLDKDNTWEAWKRVGEALLEVRRVAMQGAGTNRPYGPRFRELSGRLLRQFRFTESIKHPSDRSRLVEVMENLAAIEAWRNGLTDEQRRLWNHPKTVLERYRADMRKQLATPDDDVFRAPTAKEKIRELKSEVHELRKGAPLPWGTHDSPADKARAVMEHLSIVEAEELALALLQAVRDARGAVDLTSVLRPAPEPTPDPAPRAPDVEADSKT
jgi:hypothetical protein